MEIAIIGAGSLGLLLSSYLAQRHDVTLYVRRNAQLQMIAAKGVELWKHSVFSERNMIRVKPISELQDADCTFICVKQPEIEEVITLLMSKDHHGTLVFLQNGASHIAYLQQFSRPVVIGIVEHGASRMSDYQVNHLGEGQIKLAPYSEITTIFPLVQALHSEAFPFLAAHDWQTLIKEKLLVNAVINPLTALFDVPNGMIVTNPYLKKIAKNLTLETATILQIKKTKAWQYVQEIAQKTAHNTSSMRADIKAARKTEIEAITGYIIKEAEHKEIPYSQFVLQAILALEYERKR